MPNANIIELETCIKDALAFCDANPTVGPVSIFHERLLRANQKWTKSVQQSEKHHLIWRTEEREDIVARKQLASLLRESQQRLRRVNALDFPEKGVMYWDRELLDDAVERMVRYLKENASSLEFAPELLERFDRIQGSVDSEHREMDDALKGFQRFIDLRREAMVELMAVIGEFRVAMRRSLGKKSPAYNSIFWPYAIASDENVLF